MGARLYEPGIGRFLTIDPVLAPYNPRQNNGYNYAWNDPITNSDPTGLVTCSLAGYGGVDCNNEYVTKQRFDCSGFDMCGTLKHDPEASQETDPFVAAVAGVAAGFMTWSTCTAASLGFGAMVCGGLASVAAGAVQSSLNGNDPIAVANDAAKAGLTGLILGVVTQTAGGLFGRFLGSSKPTTPTAPPVTAQGAESALQGAQLKEHLRQVKKYAKGGNVVQSDGTIRYYGVLRGASTMGEMAGNRTVRQWNPTTGAVEHWQETLDFAGRVRQIRLGGSANKSEYHHMFDIDGKWIGRW